MRKTWWIAIQGIIIVFLGLFSILHLGTLNKLNDCNNGLIDLYQEENRLLFASQKLYNWMHYLHTLKVGELVENDTKWAIEYRDDAREIWDDISKVGQEKINKSIRIKNKTRECNSIKDSANEWWTYSFLGYLILIFVSLKIYKKTNK